MQYLRRYVQALARSVLDWTPEEQQIAILILALFLLGLGAYGCHRKESLSRNPPPILAAHDRAAKNVPPESAPRKSGAPGHQSVGESQTLPR
jgi:hypothetical protein